MINAINASVSGFTAATQRLNVSAQNIANEFSTQTEQNGVVSNTPYVPQQLEQSALTTGGVATSTAPVTPPSIQLYDPNNPAANANGLTPYPNVDPAQQLIQAQISSYDAQGNLAAIKVENNLFQKVLNIVS